jgi:hypothetical protein
MIIFLSTLEETDSARKAALAKFCDLAPEKAWTKPDSAPSDAWIKL